MEVIFFINYFAWFIFVFIAIVWILVLSFLIFLLYLTISRRYKPKTFIVFLLIFIITISPWMLLSQNYYQDPIGGFITNIRVFSVFTATDVFFSNFINLFGTIGLVGIFIPALIISAFYFGKKKKLTNPQKLVFIVLILVFIYFMLLPYREIRYLLSFLSIISSIAAFGFVNIVEKMKNYRTQIMAVIIILSLISLYAGVSAGYNNKIASISVIEASKELEDMKGETVVTQMYPYVYYFSGKRAVRFCENHFVNSDFEECQQSLSEDTFNPEKTPEIMEKYDADYVLFYRFEITNPKKLYEYLESSLQFKKINSFEEFGSEGTIIYKYL